MRDCQAYDMRDCKACDMRGCKTYDMRDCKTYDLVGDLGQTCPNRNNLYLGALG